MFSAFLKGHFKILCAAILSGVALFLLLAPTLIHAEHILFLEPLARGARGNSVVSLKRALTSLGFLSPSYNTGYFGPITETAVKRFQCEKRIICSGTGYGTLTPATRRELQKLAFHVAVRRADRLERNLRYGSTGSDVKLLQQFLNRSGFLVVQSGPGSPGQETEFFGPGTERALVRFQEAHRAQILTPNGFTRGTGFFGVSTRAVINELLTDATPRIPAPVRPAAVTQTPVVSPQPSRPPIQVPAPVRPAAVTQTPVVSPQPSRPPIQEPSRPPIQEDTLPPFRKNGSPASTLAIGTTQARLYLETDESAVCAWGKNQNVPYGNLTPFSSTSTTTHVVVVTGLHSGSHAFYVKCRDARGNSNPDDFMVNFSIAAESADVEPPSIIVQIPSAAAPIQGIVIFTATASDNKGVGRVQFKLDGAVLGEADATPPYTVALHTPSYRPGAHGIVAIAWDTADNQRESAPISISIADQNPPPIPANFTGRALSETQIALSWSSVIDDGGPVSYRLLRNGVTLVSVALTTFTDGPLSAGTEYRYDVRAVDAAENVSSSALPVIVKTLEIQAPPVGFKVSDQVGLRETVDVRDGPGFSSDVLQAEPRGTVGTVTQGPEVAQNTNWWLVSFPDGIVGWVPESFLEYVGQDSTPPSQPIGLRVVTAGSATVGLAWQASTDNSGGPVTYRVFRNGIEVVAVEDPLFTDTGLTPLTSYRYEVQAVDQSGNRSFKSNTLPASTLGVTPLQLSDGASPSQPALLWPTVSLFEPPSSKTVYVKYGSNISVTGLTAIGLQAPFSFKGGSYPGQGGTCGVSISADCTLILEFNPRTSISGATSNSYRQILTFRYFDGPSTREQSFVLLGQSRALSQGVSFISIVQTNTIHFGLALLTTTVPHSVAVFSATPDSEVKIVSITAPRSPFTLLDTENCAGKLLRERCHFKVMFNPPTAGNFEDTVVITYDTSLENKTEILTLKGEGFKPDIAKNVLVIYNDKSPESVMVKDYYLANRPGMVNANVLAISNESPVGCTTNCDPNPEFIDNDAFKERIQRPFVAWLQSHPEKDIRYVVLMYGIPSRVRQNTGYESGGLQYLLSDSYRALLIRDGYSYPPIVPGGTAYSRGYFSPTDYPGTTALVTHIAMGTVTDTIAYINKLKTMYELMPSRDYIISSRGTGKEGATHYLETGNFDAARDMADNIVLSIRRVNPAASIERPLGVPFFTSASNVRGFFSTGVNGGRTGDYAIDGTIRFSGNSGWYTIQTAESFNGQRVTYQGNFVEWFSKNAFGGTNYENTPVGAVSHVYEPLFPGLNGPSYFSCFENGQLFIDCAWRSLASRSMMTIGDPLVTR